MEEKVCFECGKMVKEYVEVNHGEVYKEILCMDCYNELEEIHEWIVGIETDPVKYKKLIEEI